MVKKGKTNKEKAALIKINPLIYKQVREYVRLNSLEYPSIKNFVENAIAKSLGFKKYDIEGIDEESVLNKPLENVVGAPSGGYAFCAICGKAFFRSNAQKEEKIRVCPSCSSAILGVVASIKNASRKKIKK